MFGPPSSPPASYMSRMEEAALRNSLLPAFGHDNPRREFVRPKFKVYKEKYEESQPNLLPTPLPTSEANQASSPIPSSPHRVSGELLSTDMISSDAMELCYNAPFQQLIIARIPLSGEKITIGRSSKSSKVSLKPTNKLASRVHAEVYYDDDENLIKIECLGWNGMTVNVPQEEDHMSRKGYFVAKHQVLNVGRTDGITIDIHGDKVLLELVNDLNASEVTEDEILCLNTDYSETNAPPKKRMRTDSAEHDENKENSLHSTHVSTKPTTEDVVISGTESKESKVDAIDNASLNDEDKGTKHDAETYSKGSSEHVETVLQAKVEENESDITNTSNPSSAEPISHSLKMSDTTETKTEHTGDHKRRSRRKHEILTPEETQDLQKVMANFVAFYRASAVPFNALHKSNSMLHSLPRSQVKQLINTVECIGIIPGSVEDTTGRKNEDTYYYIAEKDSDEERKRIVQSTKGHRSLRNCRKTPKQYFYRPLNLD